MHPTHRQGWRTPNETNEETKMTRYYFNGNFYAHFADPCNAYMKARKCLPMRAYKTRDSRGQWILAYL
jgi:hypothetical protein